MVLSIFIPQKHLSASNLASSGHGYVGLRFTIGTEEIGHENFDLSL